MYNFSDALVEEYLTETYISTFFGKSTPALQKQFLQQVKAGVLDVTLFHQAYDDALNDENLLNIFKDDGTLTHKGTYASVKQLESSNDPIAAKVNAPLIKGLKTFWVAQFKDNLTPTNLIGLGTASRQQSTPRTRYDKVMQRKDILSLPTLPSICVFYDSRSAVWYYCFISQKNQEIKFIGASDNQYVEDIPTQAQLVGVSLPMGKDWDHGTTTFYSSVSYAENIPETILTKLGWIDSEQTKYKWYPISRSTAKMNNNNKFRAFRREDGVFNENGSLPRHFLFDPAYDSWAYQLAMFN